MKRGIGNSIGFSDGGMQWGKTESRFRPSDRGCTADFGHPRTKRKSAAGAEIRLFRSSGDRRRSDELL